MTIEGPVLLSVDHITAPFDSGEPALDVWLRKRALANQRSGASRTWVVTDAQRRVVAYYASATAAVLRSVATKRAARNQPDVIPAILLARLAVDARWRGKGLGAALLKHFVQTGLQVSDVVGVRLLLAHAKHEDAKAFYLHHGFEPSPLDDLTLMITIADIRASHP